MRGMYNTDDTLLVDTCIKDIAYFFRISEGGFIN